MASRRQFIQSGLALSGASILPVAASAAEPRFLRLDRFVYDSRFPEAVDMAHAAARRGVQLAGMSGDLTPLWYDHLHLQWKRQPAALGGVTTREALFVLETLAADHRMRVIYRGEHGTQRDGRVIHALRGPASLIAELGPEPDAGVLGPLLVRAMTRCPMGAPSAARVRWAVRSGSAPSRTAPLISWIIAPRSSIALVV